MIKPWGSRYKGLWVQTISTDRTVRKVMIRDKEVCLGLSARWTTIRSLSISWHIAGTKQNCVPPVLWVSLCNSHFPPISPNLENLAGSIVKMFKKKCFEPANLWSLFLFVLIHYLILHQLQNYKEAPVKCKHNIFKAYTSFWEIIVWINIVYFLNCLEELRCVSGCVRFKGVEVMTMQQGDADKTLLIRLNVWYAQWHFVVWPWSHWWLKQGDTDILSGTFRPSCTRWFRHLNMAWLSSTTTVATRA